MIKIRHYSSFLAVMGLFFASCSPLQQVSPSSMAPKFTVLPSNTPPALAIPTASPVIKPSPSTMPTQLKTLEPEKAKEIINTLLRETGDCTSPCFWGIVPERTMVEEAIKIFNHLGLQVASTTYEGKNYSSINYDLDNGLSIEVILTIDQKYVENTQIKLHSEIRDDGNTSEWLAYSPETLINRYGPPSRVEFIVDWGPSPFFAMQIYFDNVDLIAQYAGTNIIPSQKGSSLVCPLTSPFESVWLWMGENPDNPPEDGISLEKVTSLSVDEFTELMTGDPNYACFSINGNVFP